MTSKNFIITDTFDAIKVIRHFSIAHQTISNFKERGIVAIAKMYGLDLSQHVSLAYMM